MFFQGHKEFNMCTYTNMMRDVVKELHARAVSQKNLDN